VTVARMPSRVVRRQERTNRGLSRRAPMFSQIIKPIPLEARMLRKENAVNAREIMSNIVAR
jgi:hypothetical protein